MNKFYQILAALAFVSSVSAQDLAHKIPHDAFAVVNIRTDHFFELLSVDDFDRSSIGKIIIEKTRDAELQGVNSIVDFGIALDRPGYFYAMLSDSVTYNSFLLPIANIEKFEAHFAADQDIHDHGSFKSFTKAGAGNTIIFAWNDDMLSITTPNLVDNYFQQDAVAERYGIHNYSYADYYNQLPAEEEVADWDGAGWVETDNGYDSVYVDIPPPALPDSTAWPEETDSLYVDSADWEGIAVAADSAYLEADSLIYNDNYMIDSISPEENLYDEYYAADQEVKQQLVTEWGAAFVLSQFEEMPVASVLTNRSYLSSLSKDALATVWVPSFEAIYTTLLPELSEFGRNGNLFSYYGSLQLGLFADNEGFKLKSQMELEGRMAKSFKRMYGGKLNRKFLKYINSDDAIGIFALAMDTRAYLEELPALIKNTYGALLEQYEADIALGTDLVSLLLDEAAIAKVAKGDAVFVLNGITQQEVPYISYEYDEDYNYIEVEKTKMETIPDFLLMFSSDDTELYGRIMSYATNKGYLTEQDGIYWMSQGELPFDLAFTRRNGIVFVGTSVDQLTGIAEGSYRGKLDRPTRRLLTKNKVSGILRANKLAKEIPTEQLASLNRYIAFQKIFGSMGDFYFKSNGVKGNRVSGEFVAQTPEGFDNAIIYLFSLVDYALEQR
ncbi:hypothetical protein [Parapedobacter sp.]